MLDIFFKTEYGKLYEKVENGICETFEYKNEKGTVRNTYIKRPVPWLIDGTQYYDIITPYGYGGPVLTEGIETTALINAYYKEWADYCHANGIVAEFVRFHLFDNTAFREEYPGDVIHVSDNVVRSLDSNMEDIWMQFEHKVRKNVNKAEKNGLTVTVDCAGEYLENFLNIYYDTMQRNNAQEYYYFDRNYFQSIISSLEGQFAFFHVWFENTIISTELILCSDFYTYSFLGGTLDEYYLMRPNDLLKYEIIKWSKETGRKAFILGGGYGSNDGIYRYKKAFAPSEDVPFYVGKAIHNKELYQKLVELSRTSDCGSNSGFFPAYRSGLR